MTPDIHNPPKDISLENLAHLTVALERETTATYCRLAEDMKALHNPESVLVFERLVEIERGYEAEIEIKVRELGLTLDAADTEDPVTLKMPESEAAMDLMLTPWQALNMAVQRQQNTFEFFSALAATASNDKVCAQAEKTATRKLEHIALLRLERRQAWRTDERARLEAITGTDIPLTLEKYDATSSRVLSALRQRYLEIAGFVETFDEASALLLRHLAAKIPEASPSPEFPSVPDDTNTDLTHLLRAALRETEAAFDSYMSVSARAAREDIVEAAQIQAGECVGRLGQLRDCLTTHINGLGGRSA